MMNRIAATRWPLDPRARLARATTDIAFAQAMGKIVGVDSELSQIERRATEIALTAKCELAQQAERTNDD